MYSVCVNTPGYLPESDPDVVETWEEALELADSILNDETLDNDGEPGFADIDADIEEGEYAIFYIYDHSRDHDLGRVVEVSLLGASKVEVTRYEA